MKKNKYVLIGKFLKSARIKAELSQELVSSKLGYSGPQFISNIERGTCTAPLSVLKKLVIIYKLNPKKIIQIIQNSNRNELEKVFFK